LIFYPRINYIIILLNLKKGYNLRYLIYIVNRLNDIKVFFKLDIIFIFNRLRVKKGDEEFIIFYTRFGLFKYFIILFRLYNNLILF